MKSTKFILVGIGAIVAGGAAVGFAHGGPKTIDTHGIKWYDSFADAKVVAKKSHKPILFLSMFGRLDEKMPCANARTLRATLFKDPAFKKFAQDDVVTAWEMVRPVPRVTVDLGNGETIQRTIRGNAVLYLCTPEGKVIDAYPGVYTAKDFLPMVKQSLDVYSTRGNGALKAQTQAPTAAPLSPEAAVLEFHKGQNLLISNERMTFGKTVSEAPVLDLMGAKPTEGAKLVVRNTMSAGKQRFVQAAARLRDLSLSPMTAEEAALQITGRELSKSNPEEMKSQILEIDSRNNIDNVRPVVHLYFASLTSLPTPAEARDAILETILKIPYKDKYYGLKDLVMPGTVD